MPVHKIPASSLHEDLQALEREGESVVTTTSVGEFVIVTTKFHGNNIELRGLTHAERVGAQAQRAAWDGAA